MTFDIKVEVAFNAGYRTPVASRTWTDITAYVDVESLGNALSITYGRRDEVSTADANRLTGLVLDNRDGRFTPGNAASPYYPNVKVGRPIRVTATAGATTSVRYTGFIDTWPLAWSGGSGAYATATISGSSRLSRIGLDSPLASTRRQVPLAAGAAGLWVLDDPKGSPVGSNSASNQLFGPLTPTPSFLAELPPPEFEGGDGPGVLGGKVARFDNLDGLVSDAISTDVDTGFAVAFWVRPLAAPASMSRILRWGGGRGGIEVFLSSALQPYVTIYLPGDVMVLASPLAAIALNESHHYVVNVTRIDATNWSYYVWRDKGPLPAFGPGTVPATGTVPSDLFLAVGGRPGEPSIDGCISDVAVYIGSAAASMSAGAASDLADAVDGYAGDTTDERMARYAEWAGIETAELVTTPSAVTVAGTKIDGKQVLGLMREVETAEVGVLHDDRLGRTTLRNRGARYGGVPALTVDASLHRVGMDWEPKVDRQGLVNIAVVKDAFDTEVTFTDEASRDDHGDAVANIETTSLVPEEPLMLAAARVNAYSQPRPRAPGLTLKVSDFLSSPSDLAALLALDIGSMVRITNAPSQNATSTVDYFVEGYTERLDPFSWSISLNLSPSWPVGDYLVLDSSGDGVLDQNILAL